MVQILATPYSTKSLLNRATESDVIAKIASSGEVSAVDQRRLQIAVKNGGDINAESGGRTPLEWAIETVNVRAVQFLIDSGADPNKFSLGILGPFERAHAMLIKLICADDIEAIPDMLQIIDSIRDAMKSHQIGKKI